MGGQTGPRGCSDAMNEKGVVAGGFNLPGYTEFTAVTDQNRSKALAIEQACACHPRQLREYRRGEGRDPGWGLLRCRYSVPVSLVPLLVNCPCTCALVIPTGATVVVEWHTAGSLPAVYARRPESSRTLRPTTGIRRTQPSSNTCLPYNPTAPSPKATRTTKEQMGNGYVRIARWIKPTRSDL